MKPKLKLIVLLVALALPSIAEANVGSALMIGRMMHLVFGNFLIGVLEGLLLGFIFKLPKLKSVFILILANYFSAFVGFILIAVISDSLPITITNALMIFWLMVFIAYILTLMLEFPFVAFVLRKDPLWKRKSIIGSLVIQSTSYVFLMLWYGIFNDLSFITLPDLVQPSAISVPANVTVCFIADADGDAYMGELADFKPLKIFDLNSSGAHDRQMVRRSLGDTNLWDIAAYVGVNTKEPRIVPIKEAFARCAVPLWSLDEKGKMDPYWSWYGGEVPKLGDASLSAWTFHVGHWATRDLRGEKPGKIIRLSCETLFFRWQARNAVHLPSDKVLFQLGKNQICLFDPETNQIALLAKGRGPVAVIH